MTGIAVLKVDDIGRRPLLIGGVGGLVCILSLLEVVYFLKNTICMQCSLSFFVNEEDGGRSHFVFYLCDTGSFLTSPFSILQISWGLPCCCCSCSTSLCWLLPGTLLFVLLVIGLTVMDFLSSLKLGGTICSLLSDKMPLS